MVNRESRMEEAGNQPPITVHEARIQRGDSDLERVTEVYSMNCNIFDATWYSGLDLSPITSPYGLSYVS